MSDQNFKIIQGSLKADGLKIAVVVSRWNQLITDSLLKGAEECFIRSGGRAEDLTVCWVPGSFELGLGVSRLAKTGNYQAIVALGVVIRGETPHFDYVAKAAADGVQSAMQKYEIPVSFGVLTTNTVDQAMNRAGIKSGNKGAESMACAIEMANLMKNF